ncbi:hypothetical protein [Burkholderia gladioli]|uniref:hypothetical protein n=1 Tax=Burkholderia gladioli TaxID=28095 RepID=UPI0016413CC2|nr:hypothetical protein [Burkholderia gladioli]
MDKQQGASEPEVPEMIRNLSGIGWTQEKIAQVAGCTQANISYHLRSTAKKPRYGARMTERLRAAHDRCRPQIEAYLADQRQAA